MKRPALAVAAGAVAAAVLFYSPILFFDDTYFQRDIMLQFKPWQTLVNRYIAGIGPGADWHDVVPLWNPYNHCGAPFLANLQSQVFYPLGLIFRAVPEFTAAFKLFIVAHALLAFWFMYLFLRGRGIGRLAAATGGVLWALNGMLTSRIEFLSVYATIIWLPLVLHLIDRCAAEPSLRRIAPVALALAVQLVAGHAQMWFYAVLGAGVYALYRAEQKRSAHPVTGFVAAVGIAVLLAAVQLFPTVEFLAHSTRTGSATTPSGFGMGVEDSALHSLGWKDLANILHPFAWRFDPGKLAAHGDMVLSNYWTKTFYIGVIGTILACVGFVVLPSHRHRLWAGAALFLIVLYALGSTTPFYRLLYQAAPPFRVFRHPSTAMYLIVFILCTLAGLGAVPVLQRLERVLAAPSLRPLLLALPLAVWSELYHDNTLISMLLPSSILSERSPIADRLAAAPDARLYRFMLTPLTQRDAPSVRGRTLYDAMSSYRRRLFGNINIHDELYNFRGQDIELKTFYAFMDMVYSMPVDEAAPLLGIANVRYLLSLNPVSSHCLREYAHEDLFIHENPFVRPRVYLSRAWCVEPDTAHCLTLLRSFGTDVADTAVINEPVPNLPSPQGAHAPLDAQVVHFQQGLARLSFHVENAEPVVAVISQTHYPGWRAAVNGRPHRLLRVNVFMSGILLPPGAHRVNLVYDPLSFKLGCVVSLLTILVLALALYETWPETPVPAAPGAERPPTTGTTKPADEHRSPATPYISHGGTP